MSTIEGQSKPEKDLAPSASPFGKVLSLGWYDGTTFGMAQCSSCSAIFKYDVMAWDGEQDRRIFVFSPISRWDFDSVIQLLSRNEKPLWPFWNPRWNFASEEKEMIRGDVEVCLARALRPEWLIESDRKLAETFAARPLNSLAMQRLPEKFDGLPFTDNFFEWQDYVRRLQSEW